MKQGARLVTSHWATQTYFYVISPFSSFHDHYWCSIGLTKRKKPTIVFLFFYRYSAMFISVSFGLNTPTTCDHNDHVNIVCLHYINIYVVHIEIDITLVQGVLVFLGWRAGWDVTSSLGKLVGYQMIGVIIMLRSLVMEVLILTVLGSQLLAGCNVVQYHQHRRSSSIARSICRFTVVAVCILSVFVY